MYEHHLLPGQRLYTASGLLSGARSRRWRCSIRSIARVGHHCGAFDGRVLYVIVVLCFFLSF